MDAIQSQRAPTRTIVNNREDSTLEIINSLSSFKIPCIFSVLFPLILKTFGKCGDKTFHNVLSAHIYFPEQCFDTLNEQRAYWLLCSA